VPTPWICLQNDLRRAGLDPDRLTRVTGRKMAENAEALRRREATAIQVFEPFVEQTLADGAGHIWYAAAHRGPCSYTSFYASRRTIDTRMDEMLGMTRAIYRMQKWLHRSTPQQIANAVAGFFPDLPQKILAGASARYLENGVWGKTPLLSRAGFERLGAAMVTGRMLAAPPSYEACVDPRLAEAVIAEDPPTLC
jgi:NitT/TauT family transport system substrate-binding protein